MAHTRHKMRLALAPQQIAPRWPFRSVSAQDDHLLGELMYAAYHGTIDDEGETLEEAVAEMRRTLDGVYGPLQAECSFVIEEQGRALSAALVTLWEDTPLLAFAMTAPAAKGRGLATYLIRQSASALLARGYIEQYLYVTEGNIPAQHIYAALGFSVVDTRTR